jgi:hypothetical protein
LGRIYIKKTLEQKLRRMTEEYKKAIFKDSGKHIDVSISDVIEDLIKFRENSGSGE